MQQISPGAGFLHCTGEGAPLGRIQRKDTLAKQFYNPINLATEEKPLRNLKCIHWPELGVELGLDLDHGAAAAAHG